MEDKPLTESINKQYSKYGSLRTKEKETKIELCNTEDPLKFLTRIDSSIKDAKARVKNSIDKSTISEEFQESSYDQQSPCDNGSSATTDAIPMVKIERNKSSTSSMTSLQQCNKKPTSSTSISHSQSNSNISNHYSSQDGSTISD